MKKIIKKRLSGRQKKWTRLISGLKEKRILDIGCSDGWFECFALKSGCEEIFGIEPQEKDFALAQKGAAKAKFQKGSALDIPFGNNYFDITALFDVIEHLPANSEEKALKEIKRVLRPKGILYLSCPNKTLVSNLLDPAWYFGHRHYSEKKLRMLLKKQGFNIDWIKFGGGIWSQIYMTLFYIYRFLLRKDINLFKKWFSKKREREYLGDKGFATLFLKAVKL